MFTNGSTAMECGGGLKAVRAALACTAGAVGCSGGFLEIQILSIAK